jgi:hypothetical protein
LDQPGKKATEPSSSEKFQERKKDQANKGQQALLTPEKGNSNSLQKGL